MIKQAATSFLTSIIVTIAIFNALTEMSLTFRLINVGDIYMLSLLLIGSFLLSFYYLLFTRIFYFRLA